MKVNPDLKKKRPVESLEKGEVVLVRAVNNKKRPESIRTKGLHLWRAEKRWNGLKCTCLRALGGPNSKWMERLFPTMQQSESIIGAEWGTLLKP